MGGSVPQRPPGEVTCRDECPVLLCAIQSTVHSDCDVLPSRCSLNVNAVQASCLASINGKNTIGSVDDLIVRETSVNFQF